MPTPLVVEPHMHSRNETLKKVLIASVLLFSIAAVVTFFISAYSSPSNSTLRLVSRVLVIISIVIFLALGFYLYARSRRTRMYWSRRVLVVEEASDYNRRNPSVIKAVDPAIEASFWRLHPDTTGTLPDDRICSVCLSTVDPSRPGALGAGQAGCCNGWFHKYCVLQYWQSNDASVICPNCRHDPTEMMSS